MRAVTKVNDLTQYALESSSLPIGISEYELSKLYPADFKSTMPTIEEIENQMGMPVTIMEEGKEGAGKLSERERTILKYCKKPRSAEEIMSKLGLSNQTRIHLALQIKNMLPSRKADYKTQDPFLNSLAFWPGIIVTH